MIVFSQSSVIMWMVMWPQLRTTARKI